MDIVLLYYGFLKSYLCGLSYFFRVSFLMLINVCFYYICNYFFNLLIVVVGDFYEVRLFFFIVWYL